MKKIVLMICMFSTIIGYAEPNTQLFNSSFSSKKKKTGQFDKSRILIGPGLGFGAAYRAFSFNISPSVAYCFTEHFHAGVTVGFNYFQSSEDYTNPVTNQTESYKHKFPAYSMSLYGRYLVGNFLVLNLEPEINNTKFIDSYVYSTSGKIIEKSSRAFIPSVLLGVGYTQHFNKYGYSYLMACYDLLQNPNARYYQTFDLRAGIMLNLWN